MQRSEELNLAEEPGAGMREAFKSFCLKTIFSVRHLESETIAVFTSFAATPNFFLFSYYSPEKLILTRKSSNNRIFLRTRQSSTNQLKFNETGKILNIIQKHHTNC